MSNMIDNENIPSKAEMADQQNSNELRMNMSKILANVIDLNKKYTELHEDNIKNEQKVKHLESEMHSIKQENTELKAEIGLFKKQTQAAVL
jgi:cell division protein FtsB